MEKAWPVKRRNQKRKKGERREGFRDDPRRVKTRLIQKWEGEKERNEGSGQPH